MKVTLHVPVRKSRHGIFKKGMTFRLVIFLLLAALLLPQFVAPAPVMAATDPGLIGLWRFNGDASDSSGNGLNGTVHGATYVTSPMGQALSFAGNWVSIPDNSLLEPSSITIEAWVKRSGSPGILNYIVAKPSGGTYTPSYGLFTGTASGLGGVQLYIGESNNSAGASSYYLSPEIPPGRVWDGKWHHVAGSFEHTGTYSEPLRIYLDGVQYGVSDTSYYAPGIWYPSSINDLTIGAHGNGGWSFNGQIDEVRIWNKALTAEQVADLTGPPAPSLMSPASGTTVGPNVSFDFGDVTDPTGNVKYRVQVDNDADFSSPVYTSTWTANSNASRSLSTGTYYWRAQARDGAMNEGEWSTPWTITVDATGPEVTIDQAAGQADPTNTLPIYFTVVFSKPVADFITGDVTLSGTAGATTAEVTGSDTNYNIAVSGMQASGTVIPSIAAGKAHDIYGNGNIASTSTDNSVTYNAPLTIDQAAGQADPTNTSPVNFTVVFSEPVTDFATGDVTLSGTAGATTAIVTGSGTTYNVAVSGVTSDGTIIANIAEGAAHDGAGNAYPASISKDNSVTFDTIGPTVTISLDPDETNPTTNPEPGFLVHFSEQVFGYDESDIVLSGTAGANQVWLYYDWAYVSGMARPGTVTASIAAGTVFDAAGNGNTASTGTNTYYYNKQYMNTRIDQATGQTDPTGSSPINYKVVFSGGAGAVVDFTGAAVTLEGTAGATTAVVTGSGTIFNVAVSGMTSSGTVIAKIGACKVHDASGNANNASTSTDNTVTYSSPPKVTINQAAGQADPTNTAPVNFTVVFNEPVTDFATGDVTLGGTGVWTGSTATVTGAGTTYNVAVNDIGPGTIIAYIAAGVAHGATNNVNTASTSSDNIVTFDSYPPTVTINQALGQADPTDNSPINFTVVFSKPVADFNTGDVTLGGTAGATTAVVTGTGAIYNVAVSGMALGGTVTATIAAGAAHDAAGNASAASSSSDNTVIYEGIPLMVTINQAVGQADPTNTSPINFTVVFNEPVADFATGDVTLGGTAGAAIGAVTGSGAIYNFSVSGITSDGTVIASIAAGKAHDAYGNGNIASTSMDNLVRYDHTPPVVGPPTDKTAEATGPLTPVAIGTATATDAVGVVSITSNAPSAFPLGVTTVIWTATDAAGNRGTATQKVTVIPLNSGNASDNQTWHLDSTGNPVMEKDGTQSGSVPIASGATVTWLSNITADTPVVFNSGDWKVYLNTSNLNGTYSVQIGESDGTTNGFTAFTSANSGTANGQPLTLTFNTGGTVPTGHYLALQVTNTGTGSVITDGSSYLAAPLSNPNYPVPELPAGILFGLGLIGLIAYLVIRRRSDLKERGSI